MCAKGSNLVGVEEERSDGNRSANCDGNVPGNRNSSANRGLKDCMV